MSANTSDYLAYIFGDVLKGISGIEQRKTIGGSYIIYRDGVVCGLIADNQLYFKVDDENRADFEARGSKPFSYVRDGKEIALSYWEVPAEVMEQREILLSWIESSCAATVRRKNR
jgi:DNA transformation protein